MTLFQSENLLALARLFEKPPGGTGADEVADKVAAKLADEVAAEHYRLLNHEMIPAASQFLEIGGMLGGPISRRVRERMHEGGFSPAEGSYSADHIVNELLFLNHLRAQENSGGTIDFIESHMMAWLPFLVSELRRSGSEVFARMGLSLGRVLETATAEYATSNASLNASSNTSQGVSQGVRPMASLTESTFDPDEAASGLAEIARFLSTPLESGIHVSRARLAREARALRLPTGFGSRSRMIEGFFRSASDYGSVEGCCDFFESEVQEMERVWSSQPGLAGAHWAKEWSRRLKASSLLLKRIRSAGAMSD